MERPKIELYQMRSFSDKLSAVFAFFGENWKVLLKYLTYFLLPLSLVTSVAQAGYFDSMMTMAAKGEQNGPLGMLVGSMGAMIVLYSIGSLLLMSIVYSLMRLYRERENRLAGLSWDEMKPVLMHVLWRCIKLALCGILISLIIGAIMIGVATIHPPLIFIVILAFIPFGIPLALIYPIYFFEDDITIPATFAKAFHLGFPTWGGIFGVLLVLGFMGSFIAGMISLPWTIMNTAKLILSANDDGGFVNSVGYSFIIYLFGVIQAFANFFAYSLPFIGLAYQYGHACEKVDHVTVESDIDRFEQL